MRAKTAEGSRTPRRFAQILRYRISDRSWSAAALCRFCIAVAARQFLIELQLWLRLARAVPYRRIAFCGPSDNPGVPETTDTLAITNRRYSPRLTWQGLQNGATAR